MVLEDIVQNTWVLTAGGIATAAVAGVAAYFIAGKIIEYSIVKKEIEKEKEENYRTQRNLIVNQIIQEIPEATPEYIKEMVILKIGPSKIEAEEERRKKREWLRTAIREGDLKTKIDGKIIARSYTGESDNSDERRLSIIVKDKEGKEHDVYVCFSEEDLEKNELSEWDVLETGSRVRFDIYSEDQVIYLKDIKIFHADS